MKVKKRKYTRFSPRIRSRHPSHSILRARYGMIKKLPFRSIIRLGSTTENNDSKVKVELNSVRSVQNSSSKLRMKRCFTDNDVQTALWWIYKTRTKTSHELVNQKTESLEDIVDLPYPIVAKSFYGSRNRGNTKINNLEEMKKFLSTNTPSNYLYEVYHNYAREYRLHVSKNGCFYSCRKVLKKDTPDEHKWYRNDDHCNWIREDGDNIELFDKPGNWDSIVSECVKALNSVGLDFGACDVRVQSSKTNAENPHFVIIEINSAPSFGSNREELTYVSRKYLDELPKLLIDKHERI